MQPNLIALSVRDLQRVGVDGGNGAPSHRIAKSQGEKLPKQLALNLFHYWGRQILRALRRRHPAGGSIEEHRLLAKRQLGVLAHGGRLQERVPLGSLHGRAAGLNGNVRHHLNVLHGG